ncbi:MAG: zinc ribbon-containing protein [Gammaproteobacteria bacterium]|nr:zinc ribbon-containing protein [Gammaproteobacteria bacterium]MDH5799732.1 zinc ribbon-containing protein [Gammaproteobacteria bacterium]
MNRKTDEHRHIRTYNQILKNIKTFVSQTEDEISAKFNLALESAKKTSAELQDFTREEVDLISEYIKRDIHDAAHHLAETGEELSDWLRFDTQLVEAKLLELMSLAVDTSRVELAQLTQRARQESVWASGETTSPGTLQCRGCHHNLQFHNTSIIPRCPKCNNDQFQRIIKD